MRWLLLLAACSRPAANEPVRVTTPIAIERVPPLAVTGNCQPSELVRKHFAGQTVLPCGTLPHPKDVTEQAVAHARSCVEQALAAKQPFLVEGFEWGTSATLAGGYIGVTENGAFALYMMSFDSASSTTITRCRQLTKGKDADTCAADIMECFECDATDVVQRCDMKR
jgi:hypothetical protein